MSSEHQGPGGEEFNYSNSGKEKAPGASKDDMQEFIEKKQQEFRSRIDLISQAKQIIIKGYDDLSRRFSENKSSITPEITEKFKEISGILKKREEEIKLEEDKLCKEMDDFSQRLKKMNELSAGCIDELEKSKQITTAYMKEVEQGKRKFNGDEYLKLIKQSLGGLEQKLGMKNDSAENQEKMKKGPDFVYMGTSKDLLEARNIEVYEEKKAIVTKIFPLVDKNGNPIPDKTYVFDLDTTPKDRPLTKSVFGNCRNIKADGSSEIGNVRLLCVSENKNSRLFNYVVFTKENRLNKAGSVDFDLTLQQIERAKTMGPEIKIDQEVNEIIENNFGKGNKIYTSRAGKMLILNIPEIGPLPMADLNKPDNPTLMVKVGPLGDKGIIINSLSQSKDGSIKIDVVLTFDLTQGVRKIDREVFEYKV